MKPNATQAFLEKSGREELCQKVDDRGGRFNDLSGQRFGRWLVTPSWERRMWPPKGAMAGYYPNSDGRSPCQYQFRCRDQLIHSDEPFSLDQTQWSILRVLFVPVRHRIVSGVDPKPDERHVRTIVDLHIKATIQRHGIQTPASANLDFPPTLFFHRLADRNSASLGHALRPTNPRRSAGVSSVILMIRVSSRHRFSIRFPDCNDPQPHSSVERRND